jgi:membrane protein insertase Oxa1/YidC/SpoIIIJ
MELGTVDGQGAMTQKMMMWMMPIMMAVFAFMYSAAFSIYIITSTVLSLITTIAINKIVDYKFNKENKKEEINIVRRG